jgi:cell division protein FtsL
MSSWHALMRRATVASCLLVIAFFAVLMPVKHRVQQLVDELAQIERQIASERQAIRVLTAEFSYLIKPERLRKLATQHLGLAPVKPEQLATFATLETLTPEGESLHAGRPPALGNARAAAVAERRR